MKYHIWIAQTRHAHDIYYETSDQEDAIKNFKKFVDKYKDRDDISIKLVMTQVNYR